MNKTGAKVIKGLALYGHTAQNDRAQAEKIITEWLEQVSDYEYNKLK